jgi:predicted metal-dependent phosphoesterase TrpH
LLVDLHTHTRAHSRCSALTPDALVRAARERGLDGVCITEHDALWAEAEAQDLAARMAFPVFRGIEVTTEVGHVLVFGVSRFDAAMATLGELHRIVRREGGLMFLAHPSRRYGTLPPADLSAYFDSVEAQNGTEGLVQNDAAASLARNMRLPGIGGSDSHSVREVGVCATRFDQAFDTEAAFLDALRAGAYKATRIQPHT